MIRIAITAEAFEATATLVRASVGYKAAERPPGESRFYRGMFSNPSRGRPRSHLLWLFQGGQLRHSTNFGQSVKPISTPTGAWSHARVINGGQY